MLKIVYLPIKLAETETAPGYERAHAEFFSKSESLVKVVFSLPNTRGIFVRGDLSKHPESISLVSLFFALTGEIEGTLGLLNCGIYSAHPKIALTEPRITERSDRPAAPYGLL